MYKIMVADDEGITIDALNYIIKKNFPNECIVESARTGREVIMLAESFRPDIAFMDIHMPGINGIDAIREIKNTQPGIQFVIISAYDKFSYARDAIELGVLQYINKPFEQRQIVDVLRQAMSKLATIRKKRYEDLLIREKLENVVPIIQNGFLNDLLFKEHFEEDIINFKQLLGITKDYGFMLACVFGESQEGNHMTNASGATIYLQKHYKEIRNRIENVFSDCIVSNCMANKIAVCVPYDKKVLDYAKRSEMVNLAHDFVREINGRYDICVRIGLGSVYSINDMADSYQEALSSLIMTKRSVAHVEDVSACIEYEKNYPIDMERKMFDSVKRGDIEGSVVYAGNYYEWLVNESDGDENDIRLKVIEFILWAERIAYEETKMNYVFKSRSGYMSSLFNADINHGLKEWFIDKIRQAAVNITYKKNDKSSSIIQKAIAYIEQNFTSDISLDGVSREVDVTPYYFSRLFKEELGVNFVEYVTNLRVKKAKQLLKMNGKSIKEVCVEVGYSDPNYFSRMFKKHEGLSPTEYKERVI